MKKQARSKKIAVYPGTFDPVTNGHLDILARASYLFDEVYLAVVQSPSKKTLFSLSERVKLLKQSLPFHSFGCPIRIEKFAGLMVHFAQNKKAVSVVRGLRAVSDFDYEFQMALMNRHQAQDIETVFLMPDQKYVFLSSSLIKTLCRHGGDLKSFLSPPVEKALKKKLKARKF